MYQEITFQFAYKNLDCQKFKIPRREEFEF